MLAMIYKVGWFEIGNRVYVGRRSGFHDSCSGHRRKRNPEVYRIGGLASGTWDYNLGIEILIDLVLALYINVHMI